MKKLLVLILSVVVYFQIYAIETITIAASAVPHADILKVAKPILAKEGYDLKIKVFNDYVTPNIALSQGQVDANYFQHKPYLDKYNTMHGTNLVVLTQVHIEPMGIYANKKTEKNFVNSKRGKHIEYSTRQLDLLSMNAKVGVPNDPSNEGRALDLLQDAGIISLKPGVMYPTKKDIDKNIRNINIVELDPAILPRELIDKQLDLAVIDSNYALVSNLNPLKDAIFLENKNSKFANVVVVRSDELHEKKIEALSAALHSSEVKKFIKTQYNGAIIPAF